MHEHTYMIPYGDLPTAGSELGNGRLEILEAGSAARPRADDEA